MEGIKKSLEKSLETHDQAMGKLKTGKGSITSTIERLKVLGAKTEKQLDGKHLEEGFEEHAELLEENNSLSVKI